jgi:hypothetical protein
MAIDAVIDKIEINGKNCRLYLRPRVDCDLKDTLPGQSELLIMNYTWKPDAGLEIWGGADNVVIEPIWGLGKRRLYKRVGSTRLHARKVSHDS